VNNKKGKRRDQYSGGSNNIMEDKKKIKRIHKVDIQTKNEKDLIDLGCMKNVLPRYLKIH
jgi:hypothetical protein